MDTHRIETAFSSAKENMDFDAHLFQSFLPESTHRLWRVYQWQRPGLTVRQQLPIPDTLKDYDSSTRVTGGGIVFHSPGDILFTLVTTLTDPLFPKSLKEKMGVVTQKVSDVLKNQGLDVGFSGGVSRENLQFCMAYPNPFEVTVDGHKVLGITLKRSRHALIFQGILHIADARTIFQVPASEEPYLSRGISSVSASDLYQEIFKLF